MEALLSALIPILCRFSKSPRLAKKGKNQNEKKEGEKERKREREKEREEKNEEKNHSFS